MKRFGLETEDIVVGMHLKHIMPPEIYEYRKEFFSIAFELAEDMKFQDNRNEKTPRIARLPPC